MDFGPNKELWICFYIAVIISTLFGNLLILISIVRFSQFRDNMYILIGNLAVSDMLVGMVLVPYYLLIDGGSFESGNGVLPLNKITCLAKPCIYVCCLGSSCIGLMLISLERFLTLRYPLRGKIFMTRRRVFIVIFVSWVLVLLNGTLPIYTWNNYDDNHTCISDELVRREFKLLVNWELILCLTANFFMYTYAVRIAYSKVTEWRRRISSSGITQRVVADSDLQHIVTTVIVFGAFFLCWLPYICAAIALTIKETPLTQYIRRCALIPGLLNSGINWIIYGYRNTVFRKSFKAILTCKSSLNERHQEVSPSSSCKTVSRM